MKRVRNGRCAGVLVIAVFAALSAANASGQAVAAVEAGGFRIGELAPQRLPPGRCGLFLWSRSEQPAFILYATDTPARALMVLEGREQALMRTTIGGERILGHFERQTFANGEVSFEVDLTYDRERPIQDGAIIKLGVMRTRDAAGVETILPVGGMIGCQPKRN